MQDVENEIAQHADANSSGEIYCHTQIDNAQANISKAAPSHTNVQNNGSDVSETIVPQASAKNPLVEQGKNAQKNLLAGIPRKSQLETHVKMEDKPLSGQIDDKSASNNQYHRSARIEGADDQDSKKTNTIEMQDEAHTNAQNTLNAEIDSNTSRTT